MAYAGISLAPGIIRQEAVEHSLVKGQFTPVAGYAQHIVLGRLHISCAYRFRPICQGKEHIPLEFAGLQDLSVIFRLRHRQAEHIRRLNIRNLPKHSGELRQVEEPGKTGPKPESRALRGQFHGGDGFPEGGRPGVKMCQAPLDQCVVLEIPLHGVHFHHGIGDGRAGGEDYAPISGQPIQITAFHEHV